jgi:chaperonin GroEL
LAIVSINAGQHGAVIVDDVRRAQQEHSNERYGYNVLTNQYEDMIESGIIDPTKVTRAALQNATSIATMILTTEVMVAEVPEKIDPRPLMGEY